MKTNIEKCISEKVKISTREEAIKELSLIVDVLLLVDGYMSKMPQNVLHGFDGGVMTISELREHVKEAIKILNPDYANLIQERIVF